MANPDRRIRQAILIRDTYGCRLVAQSDGIHPDQIEHLVEQLGTKPAELHCPRSHFACRFGKKSVAIGRLEDRPDGTMGIHILILSMSLYRYLGDPFAIADRYPSDFSLLGALPELIWPEEVLPRREIADLQALLQSADSASEEMALLLGSVQVLVDGGRVVLQREEPAENFMRSLWQLLPDKTRAESWPASFAFSMAPGFHAVAMPDLPSDPQGLRHSEDGLKGYPPGSYELALQTAIEEGDQAAVDHLFARRTANETIRLGLSIIAFALIAAGIVKFL